jgi:hypothetical protein
LPVALASGAKRAPARVAPPPLPSVAVMAILLNIIAMTMGALFLVIKLSNP